MAPNIVPQDGWFSPPQARGKIRFCQVRSLEFSSPGVFSTAGEPISSVFSFGRLESFVLENREVLPSVLAQRHMDVLVCGKRVKEPLEALLHELIVDVPGGHLLSVRTLDVAIDVRSPDRSTLVAMMEDAYYEEMQLCSGTCHAGDEPRSCAGCPSIISTEAWINEEVKRLIAAWNVDAAERGLPSSGVALSQTSTYHQLVFIPHLAGQTLEFDLYQRLIYRAELPAVAGYCDIVRPPELNRRPDRGAALGPFVTVLWGQQDYIENFALVSALMLVSASSTANGIRMRTHAEIRRLYADASSESDASQRNVDQRRRLRARLEALTEHSRREDVRLTFAVEGNASIQSVIPSLRVDSYHQSLYTAMGLATELAVLRSLIQRLNYSIEAQYRTLESYEQALGQSRQRRWGIVAGFLTVLLGPLSIFLAFFGINSPEIKANRSIFDWSTYFGVYLAVLGLLVVCLTVYVVLGLKDRRAIQTAREDPLGQK